MIVYFMLLCRSCLQTFTSVWRGSLFPLTSSFYVRDAEYWLPCLLEASRRAIQMRLENGRFEMYNAVDFLRKTPVIYTCFDMYGMYKRA